MVADVLGYQGKFEHDLTKPSGMKQKLVDTSLQSALGWSPKTDLRKGIFHTYQHFISEAL